MAQSGSEAREATLQEFGRQPRISSNIATLGAQAGDDSPMRQAAPIFANPQKLK
jgi:hypothetical protein